MNINRDKVIETAIHDCFKEMYAKAQPPADYDNLLEEYRSGKIKKDERIYDRHYLSQEEFKYILDKYIKAYRMEKLWDEYIEIVEDYLTNGGNKDKYIPAKIDKNGFKHPGYRSTEKVKPVKEQIKDILNDYSLTNDIKTELVDKISLAIISSISFCKQYYMFDREESQFSISITLGASPTSNKETVKEWWKENYNVDIEIEDRNPLLLWEMDEYEDEFEDIMVDADGENWKEIWDKRWEEEVQLKEKKYQEHLQKLKEEYNENDSYL